LRLTEEDRTDMPLTEFAMRRNSAHHRNMKAEHGAGELS
jgi:hypothetical protein